VESVTPAAVASQDDYPSVRVMRIDDQYLPTMEIGLKEGRNFSRAFNDTASFILNEKAVEVLKLKNPLNAMLINNTNGLKGKVVGIVGNFHFASLHHQVEPLVMEYNPIGASNMLIKIRAGKTAATLNYLKAAFARISPTTLFSYGFLDERVAGLYRKEDNMSVILKAFTGLAIILSCLGLFGLVAHATETRTKEIGIRKVIGAGILDLVTLLSKDLILLVLVGNLIAWPISWWLMNKWLQEFTYKISISWTVFALSTLGTLSIALLTMAWHCLKSANANPVRSLRTE
jgi:putative ABC transport system permease protein